MSRHKITGITKAGLARQLERKKRAGTEKSEFYITLNKRSDLCNLLGFLCGYFILHSESLEISDCCSPETTGFAAQGIFKVSFPQC